ncbi:MAG: hypothetical protein GYB55_08530 [Cytophagales bacterium]|nr:hypothetical protein [Cytophagales bacterium]
MFIRRKRNASGSFSVQIIQKVGRINKVVKTIGCSSDGSELDTMEREARSEIDRLRGQATIFYQSKEH